MQHVRLVLRRLLKNKLFVKSEKCEIRVSSVSFQVFIVGQGQLSLDLAKVQAAAEGVSAFSGVHQFLPTLYQGLQQGGGPPDETHLHKLFAWTKEAEVAFTRLKVLFTTAPVLSPLQFAVEVDASSVDDCLLPRETKMWVITSSWHWFWPFNSGGIG